MILADTPANNAVVILAPVEAMNTEVVVEVVEEALPEMAVTPKPVITLIHLALAILLVQGVLPLALLITIIMRKVMVAEELVQTADVQLIGMVKEIGMKIVQFHFGGVKAHGCVKLKH